MLHLSTIRYQYDMGFKSVVRLIDQLEQQIESLTLANQSPSHIQHLEQTIISQQNEIQRLSQIIDNKSNLIFKAGQRNYQLQKHFQSRLSKEQLTNLQLQHQLELRIALTKPFLTRLQNQI